MQHWIKITQAQDLTITEIFKGMLKDKHNTETYNFYYNGLPLKLTLKLETRNEEP